MQVPTKPAMRLKPGEMLVNGETCMMVLSVAYETARDVVTVKTAEADHKFRLNDRVAALPRNE